MSLETQLDYAQHLYSNLPADWFPEPTWEDAPVEPNQTAPNLKATLRALAAGYASDGLSMTSGIGLQDQINYTQAQSRIATASGFWLDYVAADYFGPLITRHHNESDFNFRKRILINLLTERGTRCGLICNLTNLTGYEPKIVEMLNPGDTGAYAGSTFITVLPNRTVESRQGLYTTSPNGILTDNLGNQYQLYDDKQGFGYTLLSNNARFASTNSNVVLLVYFNERMYFETVQGVWYVITSPTTIEVSPIGDPRQYANGEYFTDIVDYIPEPTYEFSSFPAYAGMAYASADGSVPGAGYYSSNNLPFQLFVQAYRPVGQGVPNVAGYDSTMWGYAPDFRYLGSARPLDYGYGEYIATDQVTGSVTDQDIYDTIKNTLPAGVIGWTSIRDFVEQNPPKNTGFLGYNFYLGSTCLAGQQVELDTITSVVSLLPITMKAVAYQPVFSGLSVTPLAVKMIAALNNPIPAIGYVNVPFIMHAYVNINPLGGTLSPFVLGVVGQVNSEIHGTGNITVKFGPVVQLHSETGVVGNITPLGVKMLATMQTQPSQITVFQLTTFAAHPAGDILGQFILGQGVLGSEGGLLGISWQMGYSRLGVDYGF